VADAEGGEAGELLQDLAGPLAARDTQWSIVVTR